MFRKLGALVASAAVLAAVSAGSAAASVTVYSGNDYVKGVKVAVGVNNLFDKDPPGCVTCSLNNYDPNAYDAPGRFFYLQLTYRQ